jgi:hypothetical protein
MAGFQLSINGRFWVSPEVGITDADVEAFLALMDS